MRLLVCHPLPLRARVLFIRSNGVLFASEGSPEMTRRYVWAPVLESLLVPYPDVCVVFLRSEEEAQEPETLKGNLGRLGQRVIDVLTSDDRSIAETVRGWREHHPEVMQMCLLTSAGGAVADMADIVCDAARGVSAIEVKSQLRGWLEVERMVA